MIPKEWIWVWFDSGVLLEGSGTMSSCMSACEMFWWYNVCIKQDGYGSYTDCLF